MWSTKSLSLTYFLHPEHLYNTISLINSPVFLSNILFFLGCFFSCDDDYTVSHNVHLSSDSLTTATLPIFLKWESWKYSISSEQNYNIFLSSKSYVDVSINVPLFYVSLHVAHSIISLMYCFYLLS